LVSPSESCNPHGKKKNILVNIKQSGSGNNEYKIKECVEIKCKKYKVVAERL
jgi:hypothetical protein